MTRKTTAPEAGITIDPAALARAMKGAAAIVASQTTLPILANARIVCEGLTVEITTSDLDTEYRQTLPLAAPGELATTVDAKRLLAMAGNAPDGAQMSLAEDGGRLTVKTGRSRWTVPTLPAQDFPPMPTDDLGAPVQMPGKALAALLTRTLWAASAEIVQPWYCGVSLVPDDAGKLCLAASDGKALICIATELPWPEDAPPVILPSKYAEALKRLCGDSDAAVGIAWDKAKIRAKIGDTVLTGKLIDYECPKFLKLIEVAEGEQTETSTVSVDPANLRAALRRIELIADPKSNTLRFERAADKVRVAMRGADSADADEELPADCAADHASGFDIRKLSAMIEHIGGDTIEIRQLSGGHNALIHRTVPDGARGIIVAMSLWGEAG